MLRSLITGGACHPGAASRKHLQFAARDAAAGIAVGKERGPIVAGTGDNGFGAETRRVS